MEKRIDNKTIVITTVLIIVFGMLMPGYAGDKYNYKDFTLPSLPDWTDQYAQYNKGDMSYFMMSKLVLDLKLTWLQSIELQNHFRDLTAKGMKSQQAFDKALELVQKMDFESHLEPSKVASSPFIVAIDMDETLLQQYYTLWKKGDKYYDYKITFPDGSTRGVSMAPGWQTLVKTIRKLGGLVVVYSANTDDVVWTILRTVTIDGTNFAQWVDGVMTTNYLIQQGKHEWMPKGKVGAPVVVASKDLRFFDKTLDKVIIIDDNPKRIIQNVRLRLPRKYEADLYYSDKLAAMIYDRQLPAVAAEIQESFKYAKENNVPFGQAYLPYTQLGEVALDWLVESNVFTPSGAKDFIRTHPEFVDKHF